LSQKNKPYNFLFDEKAENKYAKINLPPKSNTKVKVNKPDSNFDEYEAIDDE
jgi:hypothetical protein